MADQQRRFNAKRIAEQIASGKSVKPIVVPAESLPVSAERIKIQREMIRRELKSIERRRGIRQEVGFTTHLNPQTAASDHAPIMGASTLDI